MNKNGFYAFPEYTCACGKCFIPTPAWLYKINFQGKKNGGTKYYCSYTCWRKAGGDNGGKYRNIAKH